MGLIRESFCLVENNDFGSCADKEGVKRGADEGIHAASDGFEASFVTGVEKEGAAEEIVGFRLVRGRHLDWPFSVESFYEIFGGGCLS